MPTRPVVLDCAVKGGTVLGLLMGSGYLASEKQKFTWLHFVVLQVQLVGLDEESSEFICRNTFDHPYPTTKLMWIPDTKGVYPDLLATSGDYLRVWRVSRRSTGFGWQLWTHREQARAGGWVTAARRSEW